jgi:preprotein translocase subunit SecF
MIQFLRYRYAVMSVSLLMVCSFFVMALYQYKTRGQVFSYSIDFTGGTQVLLKFSENTSADAVRAALAQENFSGMDTRSFAANEVMVRVKEFSHDAKGLGERIRQTVQTAMPDKTVTLQQSEGVGPAVGSALRTKSTQAIVLALIAMLAYMAFRFWSFAFAFGAVVALAHDAIAMLAIFLFFNIEISTTIIGAILAVLGYSVNDTIVIFSQIRNNIKKRKGQPLEEVVNASINQTLTRTILTSVSTCLPILAMLIFGGDALFDFSFALFVGIVLGTYSSIYMASPIMMLFYREEA